MKIVWTEPALADLTALRDYIARDSEHYARQFIGRILKAVEPLASLPRMGRQVPEASDPEFARSFFRPTGSSTESPESASRFSRWCAAAEI
jgi:toxin ParE1/3/4